MGGGGGGGGGIPLIVPSLLPRIVGTHVLVVFKISFKPTVPLHACIPYATIISLQAKINLSYDYINVF